MKQIASEYAMALFSLGLETGEEQAFMSALDELRTMLVEQPEYMELLSSPCLTAQERAALIDEAFAASLPESIVSLIKLMCDKGRAREIPACVQEYRCLLDARSSAVTANVTSAVELTAHEKEALTRRLEGMSGKKVTLVCSVDPSLLGGVIVEMDGKIMDGSLRHRLQEIKGVMNT